MRILIVEDHAIVREACTDIVRKCLPEAEIICTASMSAVDEMARQNTKPFDLVLLDLVLPRECSGVNTVFRFKTIYPTVPIVAMSGLDSDNIVPALRRAGVMAYVSKAAEPRVFRAAILAASQGKSFIEEELAHLWEPQACDSSPMLSNRQMQVLECLAQGKPDKIMARQLHISEDTVAYHVKSIFLLLDTNSRAQAVSKGFQMGLLNFIQ